MTKNFILNWHFAVLCVLFKEVTKSAPSKYTHARIWQGKWEEYVYQIFLP